MNNAKRNTLKRPLACFMLVCSVLLSSAQGVYAKAANITTPISSISKETNVDDTFVTVNSSDGSRTFHVFTQRPEGKSERNFLAQHGCATTALTVVLSGYSTTYRNYKPEQTYKNLEKKIFGKSTWNANYRKSLANQRPVSLYGISKILTKVNIKNTYVRRFSNKSAANQIKAHLKKGNAVIIEVNNHTQVNGKFSSKITKRWALSKHTMVLLGMTDTGKAIIADSAEREWSGKKQRIKFATVDHLVKYMIPCKSTGYSLYFNGVDYCGGYILVNP